MRRYFPAGRLAVFLFTLLYIIAFSIGFIAGGNYEFAIYTVVMIGALLTVTCILRGFDIPNGFLWALSFTGILHMLGGGAHVGASRLYNVILYPIYLSPTDPGFQLFRYDQLVHIVGYGVIAATINYLLRKNAPNADALLRALLTIFATMGIGSFNEMAEFYATIILPSTGVGDYSNTLLDLISNTLGAIIAISGYEVFMTLRKK